MSSYFSILKIIIYGRSSINILLATILSFSFSIAVILCTFGLMDGFDYLLKAGLHQSSGDIILKSKKGFFQFEKELERDLIKEGVEVASPIIQTEAFLIYKEHSQGVFCRGVDPLTFKKVTGLSFNLNKHEVVIGENLAELLNIQVGEEIALTFGAGNDTLSDLPLLKVFKVSQIISHGIYQKDLRFVYLHQDELSAILKTDKRVNLVVLKVLSPEKKEALASAGFFKEDQSEVIDRVVGRLRGLNDEEDFYVQPFWQEFDYLFEAVRVEKFSISLILQLIVIVAVFNIISFVIFVMEKKAQDFFLLRALGLSRKKVSTFWLISVLLIWSLSCFIAYFFTVFFNWSLANLDFLQIPGDIYVLSSLQLKLDMYDYTIVFSLALFWICFSAILGHIRFRSKAIIQGIRQELT